MLCLGVNFHIGTYFFKVNHLEILTGSCVTFRPLQSRIKMMSHPKMLPYAVAASEDGPMLNFEIVANDFNESL